MGELKLSATTKATKEAKTAQNAVSSGWLTLLIAVLGRFPTGSSISATYFHHLCPDFTTSYHFVPHLSRKSFIVKQKLEGMG